MDEVARHARALIDDDDMVRLHGMAGLTRHPGDATAVAELIESVKNDLLGELSIVAAIALAQVAGTNRDIAGVVAARYRETVGSIALYGAYDPTLRLSYFFAVAGIPAWFHEMRPDDVVARTPECRAQVRRYLAAGRDGDVRALARLMVWFEALDTAGRPRVFTAASTLLPRWRGWFRHLRRASR
jgi:hypothetical protein